MSNGYNKKKQYNDDDVDDEYSSNKPQLQQTIVLQTQQPRSYRR